MNAAMLRVPMRVLLMENHENRSRSLRDALFDPRGSFEVFRAEQLSTAASLLQETSFDVALVELDRRWSGIETVRWLTEHYPRLPVVVSVEPDNVGDTFTILEDAAQEFIVTEHVSPNALEWSVRNSIRRKQQQIDVAEMRLKVDDAQTTVRRLTRRLKRQYATVDKVANRAAHDIRSSLTVIWEYTSILRDGLCGDVAPDQANMLDVVHDRANDLCQMADALLDYSKLFTGQLRIFRRICDVSEITRSVAPQLAKKSELQGLDFVVETDPGLPPVFCDPDMVGRALANLATRAIKSCGALGKIRLRAYEDPALRQVVLGINEISLPGCDEGRPEGIGRPESSTTGGQPREQEFCLLTAVTRELVDRNFGQLKEEPRVGRDFGPSFDVPLALPEEILERYLVRQRCRPKHSAAVAVVRTWIETHDLGAKDEIDRVLNYVLRADELAIRMGDTEWLLVVPADFAGRADVATRLKSIRNSIRQHHVHRALPKVLMEIEAIPSIHVGADELLVQVSETTVKQGIIQSC